MTCQPNFHWLFLPGATTQLFSSLWSQSLVNKAIESLESANEAILQEKNGSQLAANFGKNRIPQSKIQNCVGIFKFAHNIRHTNLNIQARI